MVCLFFSMREFFCRLIIASWSRKKSIPKISGTGDFLITLVVYVMDKGVPVVGIVNCSFARPRTGTLCPPAVRRLAEILDSLVAWGSNCSSATLCAAPVSIIAVMILLFIVTCILKGDLNWLCVPTPLRTTGVVNNCAVRCRLGIWHSMCRRSGLISHSCSRPACCLLFL